MQVQVLCFAQVREQVGASSFALELPAGSGVLALRAAVEARYPLLVALSAHLAVAIDGSIARGDAPLHDGAEVALLPPVSGG